MCQDARLIVIGTIVHLEYGLPTYRADVTFRMATIMTTATIQVDALIAGDSRPSLEVRYQGGPGESFSNSPRLRPGQRYLLFMLEREQPYELGSKVKVLDYYEFPSDLEIPADTLLRSIWEEHCQPAQNIGLRPTQKLLPIMSDRLRSVVEKQCAHY